MQRAITLLADWYSAANASPSAENATIGNILTKRSAFSSASVVLFSRVGAFLGGLKM